MRFLRVIIKSVTTWYVTVTYLAAVAVILTIAQGWVGVTAGISLLGLVVIIALLFAGWRELKAIHVMVDGQRSDLLDRIDELTEIVVTVGVRPSAPSLREVEAREDDAND